MAGDQQFSVKLEDDVFFGSPGVAIDRTLPKRSRDRTRRGGCRLTIYDTSEL